jgi:hypothetical protein
MPLANETTLSFDGGPAHNYLDLDGTGDYASAPDTGLTLSGGDIEIRASVLTDWETVAAGNSTVLGKRDSASTANQSFFFVIQTNQQLRLNWTESGGTDRVHASGGTLPFLDGERGSVRVVLDVDNGGGQYELRFYYSYDTDLATATWTQLGATVTGSTGVSSVRDTTSDLEAGAYQSGGVTELDGRIYALQLFDAGVLEEGFDATTATPAASTIAGIGATASTWTLQNDAAIVAGAVRFDMKDSVLIGPIYDPGEDAHYIASYDATDGQINVWESTTGWNGAYEHRAHAIPTGTVLEMTAGAVTRTDLANVPYFAFLWTVQNGADLEVRTRTWRSDGGGTWGTDRLIYTATNTTGSHSLFVQVEDDAVFLVHPWSAENVSGTDYDRPGVSGYSAASPNDVPTNDVSSLIGSSPAGHRHATFAMGDHGANGTIVVGLQDGGADNDARRVSWTGSAIERGNPESGDFDVGEGSLLAANERGTYNGVTDTADGQLRWLALNGSQLDVLEDDFQVTVATAISPTVAHSNATSFVAEARDHGVVGNYCRSMQGDEVILYKRDSSTELRVSINDTDGWTDAKVGDFAASTTSGQAGCYLLNVLDGGGPAGRDRLVAVMIDTNDTVKVWEYQEDYTPRMAVYREATAATTYNSDTSVTFDTTVLEDGGFSLPTAAKMRVVKPKPYLMLYNVALTDDGVDPNTDDRTLHRSKIQYDDETGTGSLLETGFGLGQAYIRRSSGTPNPLDMVASGCALVRSDKFDRDFEVFVERLDNSSGGTEGQPNRTGVTLIALPDALDYLRLYTDDSAAPGNLGFSGGSTSPPEALSAWVDLDFENELEKDASYTHSTVTNPELVSFAQGTYLVGYGLSIEIASDSPDPNIRRAYTGRCVLDGTEVDHSRTHQYLRDTFEHELGGASTMFRLVVPSGGADLKLQVAMEGISRDDSFSYQHALWAMKLPADFDLMLASNSAAVAATGSGGWTPAQALGLDTNDVEVSGFTHSDSTNTERVTVDTAGRKLVWATLYQDSSASDTARKSPTVGFELNDTLLQYGMGAGYNRGEDVGTSDTFAAMALAWAAGNYAASATLDLVLGDFITTVQESREFPAGRVGLFALDLSFLSNALGVQAPLIPDGDNAISGFTLSTGVNAWELVDEDPATPTADHIVNSGRADAEVDFDLTSLPGDAETTDPVTAVTLDIVLRKPS